MKIPDAYFSGGLGQRVAQVAPALQVDASGAAAIGQAAEKLGATLLNTATDANEYQGRIDLMQAQERKTDAERVLREQEAELKQQAKERETTSAKREYLNFTPQLAAIQQQIVDDPDIPPEEYPTKFRELSQKLANDTLYPKMNEHQKNLIEPLILEHINQNSEQMFKTGQQEINDDSWAESLATLQTLKNDPTRDARTKIAIVKDENFFSATGRPAHEIESAREKAVQEIITEDAAHKFNSTKQDLKSLQNFKAGIKAKDETGNYRYMPEWDQKEREQYVSMIMSKEENLKNEAERRRKEAEAAARQEATNLVMEYKDKVKTGWVPVSANDYRFQAQVRRAAASSPSLARQYEEASSFTTDFSKRLEMKKKDPLGVAAAERGVQLQPLNIMDIGSLPQQIAGRLQVAKQLGVKAVFKGEEIKALSEYLQTLPPRGQVQLMNSLSKPLGPVISAATFNSAAEQIRQDRPDQAVMFKLYGSGKPAEALLYAEGRAYLTGEKKDFLKDKFTTVQRDAGDRIDRQLGSALSALPNTRNTVKEAISTIYLAEAQKRNIGLDSLDKNLLQEVIRRVAGDTAHTGGRYFGSGKTTIIPDGMKPDQFLNSIRAITPQDITRRGGIDGLSDAEAATYIKGVAWHEGDAGYFFEKDGKRLYGKNGRPFVFRLEDGVGAR